ncbi:ScbA/BarX family gamma-butyrolactone biosynthesis protein [Pseudarthrobacter cellobiosi]|uniref:ScbA/BarX family gamma-butyrolactone biosynthesis protein n=1 Tax=Pseudarthrobacter cellobiosi TaxID=2953654 RepID=UPI0027E27C15|nr:ScbA/BarX family gamma-butyrolactone biosynthesis protein [Pseudarthrobacter sp. HLT1-5]
MWDSQWLNFSSTVPRELVHRAAVSEVFLTDVVRTGDDEFRVATQWPRWHVFYNVQGNALDSALLVETMRQATVLIAHSDYKVPLNHRFLMPMMSLEKVAVRSPDPSRPLEMTLQITVSSTRNSAKHPSKLHARGTFMADGQVVATAEAGARVMSPTAYSRLRRTTPAGAPALSEPVSAEEVGAVTPFNVVLGKPSLKDCWPVRVDQSHPILFDHPLDHVPGVLLIEAARQAARLAAGCPALDVSRLRARFDKLVEFSDELRATVTTLSDRGNGDVEVVVSMNVGHCVKGEFELLLSRVTDSRPRSVHSFVSSPSRAAH